MQSFSKFQSFNKDRNMLAPVIYDTYYGIWLVGKYHKWCQIISKLRKYFREFASNFETLSLFVYVWK
jgi:hypothetical protein